MDSRFETNEEVVQAAKKALNQGAWNYLVGASESETSMRRNRLSFDKVGFRPRILVDVSKIDPSSSLLGHKLRIPVILAPIGSLQVFEPEGGVASAKAADKFGIIHVSVGKISFEEEKLCENINVCMNAIMKAKPSSVKGTYLKKFTLSSTMGPGIKVDRKSFNS